MPETDDDHRQQSGKGKVSEQVCKERSHRIEQRIESTEKNIIGKVEQLEAKLAIVIDNHESTLGRHEESIDDALDQIVKIDRQVTGVLQWKTNGEREEDAWYKKQGAKTGFLVLAVGILSNAGKIVAVIKAFVLAIGGGSP